ncbi:MAG: zf-TFIIB domain-containing protein [Cetobacterium sp.]|uniref:Uncharacterized protein n=1 Tax=Cetobacterium ceti TaxID=180163 RepID=A0A1T4M3H6_9FUSO|nr:zf-TFIIB domain-containing protein [Cetobacterium ceti]MCJ8343455.1 zf-TFIIB domain-containing protein [Cetobacterium sp.]SJZ61264.1 hypothetical protein SAMN02745174_01080 [Cetobacterium ceti]
MRKLIIKCPKCKGKMRINDKVAKYRCPNCKEVYKFTSLKRAGYKFIGFFKGIYTTIVDIKNNIKYKFKTAKTTYQYMKQMKQNMKNNPNWSNYYNEMKEQQKMKKASKPSFWNKFKK